MHFNDPPDPTLPKAEQARQRREKRVQRRAVAMAAAASAGAHDARGLTGNAAEDWRNVEALVGLPVPRAFGRARRAAERDLSRQREEG